MIKISLFVEGQTELIFMREYLLKMYEYQGIALKCYTLKNDTLVDAEYDYLNDDADYYFQIINVGNDNSVLTVLLKMEPWLRNKGFSKIIGIRDMYSDNYRKKVQNQTINPAINVEFIRIAQESINNRAKDPSYIHFFFAIMEIEAWWLAIENCFQHIDDRLTNAYIHAELGYNLTEIDPEITFFHPAEFVNQIHGLAGGEYKKHKDQVNKLMGNLEANHFRTLAAGHKCNSFKNIHSSLFPA